MDMPHVPSFKYLPYLTALLLTLSLVPVLFVHKLVQTPFGVVFATALTSPFWYMTGNVITELYGFRVFMRVFSFVLICILFLLLISKFLIELKPASVGQLQMAYHILFTSNFITAIKLLLIYCAYISNAYLLNYWKNFWHGKYFWLRSVVAASVGYLFVVAILTILASDFLPYNRDIKFIGLALLFKMLAMGIIALPVSRIIGVLQRSELKKTLV